MKLRSLAASALCFGLLQAFVVPPAAAAAHANAQGERRIWMAVGERRFAVALADTDAARAFVAQLPLTLDMPDLNGNEKHVKLPKSLPASGRFWPIADIGLPLTSPAGGQSACGFSPVHRVLVFHAVLVAPPPRPSS